MLKPLDMVIVGGGLAGSLLAYRLRFKKPQCRFLLLEKNQTFGQKQTWSFHPTDLNRTQWEWMKPLLSKVWRSHVVKFPRLSRRMNGGYASIRSEDFDLKMKEAIGPYCQFGVKVSKLSQTQVHAKDGRVWNAKSVLDARGFSAGDMGSAGYQKFVGLNVKLARPHGLTLPTLMDATGPQDDGYHFFYVLPWSSHSLLIEDTYYSDDLKLDEDKLENRIYEYATLQGWAIKSIESKEKGVLPIPFFDRSQPLSEGPVPLGVRSGAFHSTTGYSLPDTVEMVDRIADLSNWDITRVRSVVETYLNEEESQRRFFCWLNRLLFLAAEPEARIRIFESFYRKPEFLMQRFYAGKMNLKDRLQFFMAKPPVSVRSALGTILLKERNGSKSLAPLQRGA